MSGRISPMQLTEYLYTKAGRAGIPIGGTFELSPVCNFTCPMCYVRKTAGEVAASPRPILTLDRWLELARQAREQGLLYLLLTGGEPLLWPDFWTLYEQLIQMGFLVSINTNGSLIDEAAIERLKRLAPRRVNITLYGAGDDTYERQCRARGVFSRVRKAIEGLQDAGIPVKLNGTITPDNVCDLEDMVAYAQSRKLILETTTYLFPPVRRLPSMTGVNQRFTPEEAARHHLRIFELQNGPERYRAYLEKILRNAVPPPGLDEQCTDPRDGKIRCRAGRATFWVTWDGYLTPCGMMPEPKVDLTGRPFGEAWRELTERSAGLALSGVCGKCPNAELCHSCAAMAMAETGSASGIPKYLCRMTRAMRAEAENRLAEGQ
ncbi:radical SAM protein [Dysosmobacter sp.]|uniref:radical SAM protein n=1 Tax=Dysosmobacter sp. TaxID=2591382 RepID=UPI002A865D9C|nr:radical SAM protein [Dysosmobacter sp.]MDY3281438.1 radical SAM protein [Dysosmobacter sp.]